MPWMRNGPSSPSSDSVRLRNYQRGHDGWYGDARKSSLNFLTVGFFIKPIRFVRGFPRFQGGGLSALSIGPPCPRYWIVCIQTDRQLERVEPSAASSLEEDMEETLMVHRLGAGELLRRSLSTTNPIESCLSTVERVARNVKRWHGSDQALRRTATGLLEAERKFLKVKGVREPAALQRKLNPSLTQQAQVA